MNNSENTLSYSVIIDSIGTASPATGKFLSESFGISHEIISRLLYCTPSVMFNKIDKENALKCSELLSKLGLEVSIIDSNQPLPNNPDLYDVAIYINDPLMLPEVTKQLKEFLGCNMQEAFNLLVNDPSVVLGNVSINTAHALSKIIKAEVVISKPDEDLYTLKILTDNQTFKNHLNTVIKSAGIDLAPDNNNIIENISYDTGRDIWRRMNSNENMKIFNQSFQRYEILLSDADRNNSEHIQLLHEYAGIPENIINEVLDNTPVILHESVNRKDLQDLLTVYTNAGLKCSYNIITGWDKKLILENIPDTKKAEEIINQFYPDIRIDNNNIPWQLNKPLKPVIARYMTSRLEQIGCSVETIPFNHE